MTDLLDDQQRQCMNCKASLGGEFCTTCGQRDREFKRPLLHLLQELLQVVFELDGRAYRTIFFLFTRPAFLSREYVAGRRASYTPPLRLFLILSILLFFFFSLNTFIEQFDTSLSEQSSVGQDIADTESEDPDDEDSDTDLAEDFESIEEALSQVVFPFLSSEVNSNLISFLLTQTQTNYQRIREDPSDFIYGSLEYITFFMLLMMPLLALIQKILYVRGKHYYVEHFILTLHNHTFLVLIIMIELPLSLLESTPSSIVNGTASTINTLLDIWIVVYLYLSLKYFFGQGHMKTALKFMTATVTYSMLLSMGLAIFMAIYFILF